jgi:hypothetical protein
MVAKNGTGNLVMKPILIESAADADAANAKAIAVPASIVRSFTLFLPFY